MGVGIRAKNKIHLKLYIDKGIKEEFRHYTKDKGMSKVITELVEGYIAKAKDLKEN